jgi:RNA polymerase sigma factor (TIGR02999 family)
MKKVDQPHFPMFSCFTLPTAICAPFAQPHITRKTGCIFTIFNKPRDLEFVRAISHFRPPVSFEKNTVFARSLPMAPLNFSQCILGKKSACRKNSLPPVAGFITFRGPSSSSIRTLSLRNRQRAVAGVAVRHAGPWRRHGAGIWPWKAPSGDGHTAIIVGTGLFSKVTPMSDVTQILAQIESGDPTAAEQLLPLVYHELRKLAAHKLAQEKPGQTLPATALVHEAYLRLVDVNEAQRWNGRGHFFAAAAEAMRRILVESARRKKCLKRGAGVRQDPLADVAVECEVPQDEILALDEALTRLAKEDPQKAEVVQLRFFAGLSHEEAAQVLGISAVTVKRHWRYARAWLHKELHPGDDSRSPA